MGPEGLFVIENEGVAAWFAQGAAKESRYEEALGIAMRGPHVGLFAETALGTVALPILFGLAWSVVGYALWSYEAKPPGDLLVTTVHD